MRPAEVAEEKEAGDDHGDTAMPSSASSQKMNRATKRRKPIAPIRLFCCPGMGAPS
jgi:hypothetical protein